MRVNDAVVDKINEYLSKPWNRVTIKIDFQTRMMTFEYNYDDMLHFLKQKFHYLEEQEITIAALQYFSEK